MLKNFADVYLCVLLMFVLLFSTTVAIDNTSMQVSLIILSAGAFFLILKSRALHGFGQKILMFLLLLCFLYGSAHMSFTYYHNGKIDIGALLMSVSAIYILFNINKFWLIATSKN